MFWAGFPWLGAARRRGDLPEFGTPSTCGCRGTFVPSETKSREEKRVIRAADSALIIMVVAGAVVTGSGVVTADDTIRAQYEGVATRIISAVRESNKAYDRLQELCDDIGHRLSGTPALDRAIEWAVETLRSDGHENVRTERVMVPRWVRGEESLEMIAPHRAPIPMLGLGGSVATPPDGITAEVLVVADEDDLKRRGDEARGRIVLFNFPMPADDERNGAGYGPAVKYRVSGARMAAAHGAVAALVRSVTTRSLQTPHTGGMRYGDAERKIPAAAISVEFAEQMARLQARGIPVKVTLKMQARMSEEPAPSANVIAELRGRELPDEIVVIGAHIDSWDVGQGAHDDGGGCVVAMEALRTLRRLNLRARRTIRVVLWTNEENGLQGGRAYAKQHADELDKHVAAIESDSGVFAPIGFGVDIEDAAQRARVIAALNEICTLLKPVGDLSAYAGYGGADIGPMKPAGVPLIGQESDMTHYFDIHHTHADTVDKVDPGEMSDNVAVMAVAAYILADLPHGVGTAGAE
ncbi:MAG: peptidase M28 family protein [Planctomycetota bacterium]|nr:MAG: peptidase M28 family protein [Planctomycetota bacterium]